MKGRVGEEFRGVVTGVTSFGLFVTLDSLYVEGLIHVSELGAEYFQHNDIVHELRGERTGRRFRLYDPVSVLVSRVDLDARRIEFRLVPSLVRVTRRPRSGGVDEELEDFAAMPTHGPDADLLEDSGTAALSDRRGRKEGLVRPARTSGSLQKKTPKKSAKTPVKKPVAKPGRAAARGSAKKSRRRG
jgi:ribonuclease R